MRLAAAALALCLGGSVLVAQDYADMAPRDGWAVYPAPHDFDTLVERTRDAVRGSPMNVVTQAGPTGAAAQRGITIPGNRVIGVFNNQFAVEILGLSTAAMVEAPLRLYVTENADGTATLSYKVPTTLYASYEDEGGAALMEAAAELDGILAGIAAAAILP